MTIILDGKKLAEKILKKQKKEIAAKGEPRPMGREKNQLKLKLAVVLVGDDRASKIFIRQKEIACKKVGVDFQLFGFPANVEAVELEKEISKICRDESNSGVLIQLPLPKKFKKIDQKILNLIPPEKDIDILSERNLGRFYSGTINVFPPVVGAVRHFLKEYKIRLTGKNVLVAGAGRLVGFPLALWLFKEGATVSVINEFTKDIASFSEKADIVISGIGKAGLIRGEMLKKGAVVIDVGISFKGKKVLGDVDFASASKKASYITPVPGGVGPMTVACLIENLVKINE